MAKPRARTLYLEGHSVTRAPHYVARKFCYVDFQIFLCRQRVDCRGSRVDSRGLRFAVRGSRFVGCGSRVAVRGSVVCYVDVLAVWHVFRVISGIRTTTVSDAWPHVDRRGIWRVSRGTAHLLHHLGHFWRTQRDLVP